MAMYNKLQDKGGNLIDPATGRVYSGRALEVPASTDYVSLLIARPRWSFQVFNNSTSPMFLQYVGTEYMTWSVRIPPKWYFESSVPVFQGGIAAKWDIANGEAHVTEFI